MAISSPRKALIKVRLMRDGPNPTTGDPTYALSIATCVEKLGLKRNQRFADLGPALHFAAKNPRRAATAQARHVICEIDDATAVATDWLSGFYRVPLSPRQAVERLGKASASRKM